MAHVVSHGWGRDLPHIEAPDRTYFITFATCDRRVLSASQRDVVMSTVLQGHLVSYALYVVVIMPDHAHLIATPDAQTNLQNLTKFIKGTSAHHIGGRVWQRGYFDRIIRRDEDLRRLGEYVVLNPVRAGLVANVNDYRWLWRSWVEGRG